MNGEVLICEAHVKEYILRRAVDMRPGWTCKRVSKVALDDINTTLRLTIDGRRNLQNKKYAAKLKGGSKMNFYIVESRVTVKGEHARYHIAADDAVNAIYEASKAYSKMIFNSSGPFMVGFRRARAAQRAFLAGVVSVVKAFPDAVTSNLLADAQGVKNEL